MSKYFVSSITFLALALFGCGDTGRDNSVPVHKSPSGGGSQGGTSEKIQKEALKAGVLLAFQPQSLNISDISASEVKLGLRFLLNEQNNIGFRRFVFNIQNGEELTLDNSQLDLTPDSRLKIELYRYKGTATDAKDTLAIQFQLENRERSDSERAESSLVLLLELTKSKKTPIKASFFYPTPENFNLKKWSEEIVKDSKLK